MSKLTISKMSNGNVYLAETFQKGGHSEYRQMRLIRGNPTYKKHEKTIKTLKPGECQTVQGIYPR